MTILFIQICWVILISFLDYFGLFSQTRQGTPGPGSRLAAICLSILGCLFFAGIRSFIPGWPGLDTRFLPDTLALRITGDVTVLIGLIIALWARTVLGGNWSASVTFKENHELIERGPYRFVRHPIYTGILLMILGTAIISGRAWPFLILIIGFLVYWQRMRQEEALLTRHFPEAYPDYKSRTKAIIPFLF